MERRGHLNNAPAIANQVITYRRPGAGCRVSEAEVRKT